jgi:hypothetical protein
LANIVKRWSAHTALMSHLVSEPENEQSCWLVDFSLNKAGGYPQVSIPMNFRRVARETKRYAYHLSYELFNGPLKEGHEIDHMCEEHRCVNPDHLRCVPQSENRRGGAKKTNLQRAERSRKGAA